MSVCRSELAVWGTFKIIHYHLSSKQAAIDLSTFPATKRVLTIGFNFLFQCTNYMWLLFLQSIVGFFVSFPFGPSFFSNLSLNHTFRVEMFLFKINEPFSVKLLVKDFFSFPKYLCSFREKRKSLFSTEIIHKFKISTQIKELCALLY